MDKCLICQRRESLEQQGVAVVVGFQGKSGCIPSYTIRRELRNEDGYYEGDGGEEWLCHRGFINLESNEQRDGEYLMFFDTVEDAVITAERFLCYD